MIDLEKAKAEIREVIQAIETEANRIDDKLAPYPFLGRFRLDMLRVSEYRVKELEKLLLSVENLTWKS